MFISGKVKSKFRKVNVLKGKRLSYGEPFKIVTKDCID